MFSVPANNKGPRGILIDLAPRCAGALVAWLMSVYTLSLLSLSLGQGIWPHVAPLALAAIPAWLFFTGDQHGSRRSATVLAASLVTLGIVALGFWFSSAYVDFSWDGAAYHQEAIIRIAEGWPDFPRRLPESILYYDRLDNYPKAIWIIAASIYQASGNLDGAKLIHIVLFASALLMLLGALAREPRYSLPAVSLIALVAALNPVTIYQSHSFYVDGQLGSLLTILLALILLMVRAPRRQHLVLLALLLVLIVNTKQTGIAYAGLLTLALLALIYIAQREHFRVVFVTATMGGLLATLLFGYSPYVSNTINHGNPFYPVFGEEDIDIEIGQRPPGFDARSGISRLMLSTFSEPTLKISAPARPRPPFSMVSKESIARFAHADIRLAGWGVLFSGGLLLALAGLTMLRATPRAARLTALALWATLVISVLINPEAWWARFVPQWYLATVIPGALLLLANNRPVRIYGALVLCVLLLNSTLVAYAYYPYQRNVNKELREQLQQLALRGFPINVYLGNFPSNRIRLREAGIKFTQVDKAAQLTCRRPHRIFVYEGLFCFQGEF